MGSIKYVEIKWIKIRKQLRRDGYICLKNSYILHEVSFIFHRWNVIGSKYILYL